MLSFRPKIKIIATILAKNEEDIIASTIEHHLKQGVYKIIFTDNGSTDQTKNIVSKYPEVVEIIDETGEDHNQSVWVTRMAQIACKLNPDWIVHLDADEHWMGLMKLADIKEKVAGCERMYLHPPVDWKFDINDSRFYLDFDHLPIPQECKIAHRPDPNIIIGHGNHNVLTKHDIKYTKDIWRHHYPIRSFNQWKRKSFGHEALKKRNAICERWELWHSMFKNDKADSIYKEMLSDWHCLKNKFESEKFQNLLQIWATSDMQKTFKETMMIPKIKERLN